MIDITREVESREALEKSEAVHQRHLRQKLMTSLLAATVTHEISQPLSRLLLRAQLATSDPEAAVAALRSIASDAELVVRIIERVKVLLRSVETEHFPVDLGDVVSDSLLQVGWEAKKQCIAIESRSGGGAVWVDGDRTQLQIALTNLIRNAIEAIRDAGSPIRRVTVVLEESQDDARLIVTDTGPGWTGAERSELPLASTKVGGSGLGLYVVRAIMENHRGVLELRSPPGGGAEAVLAIPRMIPSGRSGPAPSS
jgi:signal transduction histidine kinase